MGIAVRTLLDIFEKASSWIWVPSVSPASETWMSTLDDDRVTCPGCSLPSARHQCQSCGRMLSALHERLQLHDSSIKPPPSPEKDFKHNKPANLAELHRFSSSTHFRFSTYRSDEEEDGLDGGKHFVSPNSRFSPDVSDVDSISFSCSQELYSFRSANSSPLDSPSKPGDNGDSPWSKAVNSDHEEKVYSNKPGVEVEDSYYMYDNLSPYRSHANQKSLQTLDFENDLRIWYPPPPEDVNDDMENGFFEYNDEDDDLEGSDVNFSSNCFGDDAFPIKEKLNDRNKEHLGNTVRRHFTALVLQLLKDENIQFSSESGADSWLEIVSTLAWQAARFVKPDTKKGGSMDPSNYVKVKCVTTGNPCDSTFIKGVVFTKNVKHKRMVSQHKKPRVLLLGGALEYQRVSNKLASINTVIEKESDHLKVAVAKIEAHRPNVLLVEKSVSSYAQEYLLAKEISLVLNVKKSNLERISRCTGAQLVPSIDYITSAKLGQCEVFRVEKVVEDCALGIHPSKKSVKTLMYFEGCPRRLGCTVILRGASLEELKKVKRVVSLAIFAAYHLSLETSFLADEGATLPKHSSKVPSSVPLNLVIADAAILETSLSGGPSAENHKKVSLCRNYGMQSLFLSSDASHLNEGILNITTTQNDVSSANHKLTVDISSLFTNNSQDEITSSTRIVGQRKKSSSPNPRNASTQVGDSLVSETRNIASFRHLISAGKPEGRNDGLEVPEEYFSTADSQRILVSFSSSCIPKGTLCEPSQLFRIKFYGKFDKPLGKYLREDLFDQASNCRLCNEPVEVHIRCYTHQQGSLTISVRRLTSMKLPGARDGRIWMWHRCLKCEPKDGIPPATHRVVLSDAAWGLSFGKFLELSFSNHATANRLANCGHSLQKDCLRFYGFGNMVAFFRYSPIDILSVYLPPLVLDFTYNAMQEWLRGEAILILSSLNSLHLEIYNLLEQIDIKITMYDSEPVKAILHKHILELKDVLQRDRIEYDFLLKPASTENDQPSQGILDILELNRLKHRLLIDSIIWDRRLCLLDSFSKSKSSTAKVYPQVFEEFAHVSHTEFRTESVFNNDGRRSSSEESTASSLFFSEDWSIKEHEEFSMQVLECDTSNLVEMDLSMEAVEGCVGTTGLNLVSGHCHRGYVGQIGYDGSTDTMCSKSVMSPISNLSDRIDLAWTGSSQLLGDQITSNEADSVGQLSLMNSPRYMKLKSTVRVNSFDSALRMRNKLHRGLSPLSLRFSSVKSFDASGVSGMDQTPYSHQAYNSPSSIKRLDLLASHIPIFISSVSCIAAEGARLLIPQGRQIDVVIALYDNEPTSIISYAISSQEHANFISCRPDRYEMSSEDTKVNFGLLSSSVSQFQSVDVQSWNYSSNESKSLHGSSRIVDHKELHFKFSFDDDYSIKDDRVKFSVTCHYAKQFDALRKMCCTNDMDFIRSLSRCKKWNAQGGKSNVYFAKSLDERFIIKQVTRTELDSFEDFAPEYFNYLTDSINSGSPTCLAKVLGIYQVTVKHIKGGREVKMDLMVMENLLYGRNVSRVYDLKGSLSGRYNPDTSGTNNVLLDLNLLETLRTKPILLSTKAKNKLERAIWNDTCFLASIDVMDYSLLVGVDEGKKDLVVGIIDYMRQYTWDKHLETWVKASGILGGSKNSSPTVISPLQYKKRFRKAMSKYFLTVPDQWSS